MQTKIESAGRFAFRCALVALAYIIAAGAFFAGSVAFGQTDDCADARRHLERIESYGREGVDVTESVFRAKLDIEEACGDADASATRPPRASRKRSTVIFQPTVCEQLVGMLVVSESLPGPERFPLPSGLAEPERAALAEWQKRWVAAMTQWRADTARAYGDALAQYCPPPAVARAARD